ncbi:uncharacterized protein LOC116345145 [Contarinia nasturtii]|uniref:uncharacterized protein LOC116345145 n=1 Tax=Contarinia nasturtii TaxID=265458 RepID=UPI0012D39C78|nr:uncharacterized protein LOC116345145 [Contarinia nasturtii]
MVGTTIWFSFAVCCLVAIQTALAGESNEHIHIKLHVPQIIKKHTHTRTIYKHHFVKPKSGKSLSHGPILQTLSASPSSLKLSSSSSGIGSSSSNLLKAIPSLSESESIALGFGKNMWRPSASDYRTSEMNYVPKKMKVPKKKNPFKMLEMMAEAHAEGHEVPPHIMKKLKPALADNDNSETSEYFPDYMLANADLYNSDDNSASDSDSSKGADLIYVAPQVDKYKAKKTSLYPSKVLLTPTLATALKGKKPRMTHDWMPGTYSTSLSSTSSTASDSDSDDESEIKHTISQMLKRNKLRKPKRITLPTLHSPSEDHINILKMTRKPMSITNFTKFKNRLSAAASTLNTSI